MIGRTLGGVYRIADLVGGGGFADVYLGRDLRTNTVVAIKVLHAHYARDPAIVQRFLQEARTAQVLTEPHVVRVLDAGHDAGTYYIVMEYVQGHTLQHLLRTRGPLPVRVAVECTIQVLQALQAAHRAGIIHRDIKPQNIMVSADGSVKVMDFGIAKHAAVGTMTNTGTYLGTPQYMSPEQTKSRQVDARSDLYSTAITLFELLAGQPPFDAEVAWEVMGLQVNATPPPVTQFRPGVPPALQQVIATALEKLPERRFQDAGQMIESLRAAVERMAPLSETDRKWLTGLAFPLVADTPARRETPGKPAGSTSERKTSAGEPRPAEGKVGDVASIFDEALSAFRRSKWERAKQLLQQVVRLQPAGYVHQGQTADDLLAEVEQRLGSRPAIAVPEGVEKTGSEGIDPATDPLHAATTPISSDARWRPGLSLVARALTRTGATETAMAFSTSGSRLAIGCEDHTVTVWEVGSGEEKATLRADGREITGLAWASGRVLAVGAVDGLIRLWDLGSARQLRAFGGEAEAIRALAFSPDGRLLASAGDDTVIRLWDVKTGEMVARLAGHSADVWALAFSPDGAMLVSGGWDDTVRLWEVANGRALQVLTGHTDCVQTVAFAPDGKSVASGAWDDTVRVWHLDSGMDMYSFSTHPYSAGQVRFAPDGTALAAGVWGNRIKLWDVVTGADLCGLQGECSTLSGVAFTTARRAVAGMSIDGSVCLWRELPGGELGGSKVP